MNTTPAPVDIVAVAVSTIVLASLPAQADDCSALVSAIAKLDHTPHRILSLTNGDGPRGPSPITL